MLFNSALFLLVFFPIVTLAYYALPHRFRIWLLLGASAYFYAVAIPTYLLVLVGVVLVDYAAGLAIERAAGRSRRAILGISICVNVGLLAVFKYLDFFSHNAESLVRIIGWNYSARTLGLLLPIGLSFHTFQSMAYTIEVYRGRQAAERHLGVFALYVLFYPQLVAGPIERPQHLLPQLRRPPQLPDATWELGAFRAFRSSTVIAGLQLIVVGLFKKMVIADRLAVVVDAVYGDPTLYRGVPLIVATVFFAVQIYCDFSGYTDIARGAARVMGVQLRENFDRPYGATSIADFWHRWHMSLSTWFRDYLYIPLGGSRSGRARWIRNVLITFVVSGLWHGASWTFVLWGALHGAYLVVGRLTAGARAWLAHLCRLAEDGPWRRALKVATTFALTTTAWILFRATTISDAWYIASHLSSGVGAAIGAAAQQSIGGGILVRLGLATLPFAKHEWIMAGGLVLGVLVMDQLPSLARIGAAIRARPLWVRWPVYYALVLGVVLLGVFRTATFIYFQF
jgi:alginate O-acetyltransferase complex protein AlgI